MVLETCAVDLLITTLVQTKNTNHHGRGPQKAAIITNYQAPLIGL